MPATARPFRRRRLAAGLAPVALVLAALPLLAPTCGGGEEGQKTFARSSLIIPMDRCYQFQTDPVTGTGQPAGCPQAADAGDVIKAYGLVYQLIRNGVAVYWVIAPNKASLTATDLSVQYDGGFPVLLYNWTTGGLGGTPRQANAIDYMGGPFVVDGSDYAKASAILQQYRSTFQNVNVHVSNVAFQGYVKKTMAGGWSAGGSTPPKVALLDIGSTSNPTSSSSGYAKNSEPIIRGYLARAGLDFAGAGGTSAGPHGVIYDRLTIADFQPAAGSTDPATSKLFANGYQILWVPHWFAPGSCADASSQSRCFNTLYSRTDPGITDRTLQTIGAFVAAGKDLFAECAGLGSFEGVPADLAGYQDGEATTHFHATSGLAINKSVADASIQDNFSSPLMQLGDFPFKPRTGAIQNYKPGSGSAYQPNVVRLAKDASDATWDYFTLLPGVTGGDGTVVYLGGHVYSGYADTLGAGGALQLDAATFQLGGTRLVLNTLFNLGAACTTSGVACATGHQGVCATGALECGAAGVPACIPAVLPGQRAELCNGLDDDCDGLVDEDLETACYGGPAGTEGVGLCRAGVRSCVQGGDGTFAMSACTGELLPSPEVCNALDDDCDGATDEDAQGAQLAQACYFGAPSTLDPSGQPRGECRAGVQSCEAGNWGACEGQVLPTAEESCQEGSAGDGEDDDCDGQIDQNCSCTPGATRPCYGGAGGTSGVGPCVAGLQTCEGGSWGACVGEVLPQPEICGNDVDENCNGMPDGLPPVCAKCLAGDLEPCYSGPAGTEGAGVCHGGNRACIAGDFGGACLGEVLPSSADACDGIDNDCDGDVDDGPCEPGFRCEVGVCVPDACGTEMPCPSGYDCVAGTCRLGQCNGVTCAPGKKCQYGACVDPCAGVVCGAGNVCASGTCTGGSCYFAGCPDGELCLGGACAPDPCADVLCPSGTFCRQGDCVQACTFVSCYEGEKCGPDGFCVPDGCANVTCSAGERCANGTCVADPCSGKSCGAGQVCAGGTCVDDPCAGVECPAGACVGGQCYPTGNPTGSGTIPREVAEAASGGCGGCGSGGSGALLALLGVLLAPLARRREVRRGGGALVAVLAATVLLGAACKGEDEARFDPASCEETCGEERCVDVTADAAHCGVCGGACGTGETCVDATCGPAGGVAPFVRSVSPGSGPKGGLAPVVVEVSGERFQAGATVRSVSPAGTRTFETEFVDPGRLRVPLDLSQATPTTWQLRVVNPDRVISNGISFDVVAPSPVITSIEPAQALASTTTNVTVTGTGFTSTSQCHLSSAFRAEVALPSTLGPSGLVCRVDAGALSPGAYQLWVVNEGNLSSGKTPFTVASDVPELLALSPSAGATNAVVAITLTGDGFDPTSIVFFGGEAIPTTFIDASRLYVAQVALGATEQDVAVTVRNASGATSNAATFHVGSAQATILTLSPATAFQGDVVTLAFDGSGFEAGSALQAAAPGGAFTELAAAGCTSIPTRVCGSLDLRGRPEGSWLVRLHYPDGSDSAPWSLRVLSNQAILRDASPRGGAVGQDVSLTLTAGNLRPPYDEIRVLFGPAGSAPAALVPTPPAGSPPTTVQVAVPLAGKETGTYTLQLQNPNGAEPSNAISFNVTPGTPGLASLAPGSAIQSDTPVTVGITGTNFAKPGPTGAGGSVVHISAPELGIPDYAIPAADTTVVSATRIEVRLDTRTALRGRYDVSVWNPSAPTTVPPAPQKSNVLADAFEIL